MNIGIIGCGLIGNKRAQLLQECILKRCVDHDIQKAEKLAAVFSNCIASNNWHDVINDPEINIVIIATPHYLLPEITLAAINAKKHVLVEKPAAKNAKALDPIIHAAKKNNVLVRVGFNHRYHRAMQKAKELINEGALGELMFLRARYGHGGRLGYEKEWRANPVLSGGGELIDQGVHVIDLARWFLGDFTDVVGHAHTYFWNMPVDDNAFLILQTAKKQTAFLHVSCTEWKNTFSFEIYGKNGKIAIDGLGGSYGIERITFYKMLPEMGPPEAFSWEYPTADNSWEVEFIHFLDDIKHNKTPEANLGDAHAALVIVDKIYKDSHYDCGA
ncbi:MAG: LmbZ [Gammaproteobacteria bacterium RIFCSPHIGHO2_02_FULL_39_13]|nr:MAG: LmbZ [Gammaproteobacteria bacterium RIFCSPHIGHO2_02_FULL_39_13]OGT48955.1 MAG: LmbZ [Gammaproteobacteria bacterium RIFCSPHIGHO2_12_FULL_39_24]